MAILAGAGVLAGTFGLLWLFGHGLPETMRGVALWLLVEARRLEEARTERAHRVKWALEMEVR